MSKGFDFLHSHSWLERELGLPKHQVLVDAKFIHMFARDKVTPLEYQNVKYFKVPTISFVRQGGLFKNFSS
jgi:hypothetical protein